MMMMLPHQVREVLLERTLNPEDAQRSPALDPARAPAQPSSGPSVRSLRTLMGLFPTTSLTSVLARGGPVPIRSSHPHTPRSSVRWGGADSPCELISQKVFSMSFCKSPFPHKDVNLLCILVMIKHKLTDLCGN